MPLRMAPLGEEVEIRRLAADEKVKRHLENLGLAVGQRVTVLSAEGGAVIDTPGIKGFGLLDIDDAELWHYFPEMMRVAPGCRFYNCTHTHEPDCAVVEAVKVGEIAWSRYESYLKILDDDEKYRK